MCSCMCLFVPFGRKKPWRERKIINKIKDLEKDKAKPKENKQEKIKIKSKTWRERKQKKEDKQQQQQQQNRKKKEKKCRLTASHLSVKGQSPQERWIGAHSRGVVFQESGMSCRQDKSERMPKTDQGNLINLEKAKVLRKNSIHEKS